MPKGMRIREGDSVRVVRRLTIGYRPWVTSPKRPYLEPAADRERGPSDVVWKRFAGGNVSRRLCEKPVKRHIDDEVVVLAVNRDAPTE